MMFYKHWKKLALALTGFFWVGCDSDGTSASGENQSLGNSSDSKTKGLSSGSVVDENSSSSAMQQAVALYGVSVDIASCFLDVSDSTVVCDGNVACKMQIEESWESPKCIEDICPDYGVVRVSDTTYECGGTTYNEAEFRSMYNITDVFDPSKEYITCSETGENTVTCRDGITYTITTDGKGNKTYTDGEGTTLSEKEFYEKYVILMAAPLYGISW